MFQDLWQDLRIALRGLLRAPMMTLTIVVTVGLGIGATTVIFSAVHAALLRPLPYADRRPPRAHLHGRAAEQVSGSRSPTIWRCRPSRPTSSRLAGYTDRVDGVQRRQRRRAPAAGSSCRGPTSALLGIRPALGRDFAEADGRPGNPLAVIVSRGFWQQRLGGRPDAIGKPIRIDGADHIVVGVLPQTVGPLEQRAGLFHCRPVAAAAAQRTVLHHRARPPSKRIGTLGGGRRAARDQPAAVSDLAVVVSGRQSDLEHDRSEAHVTGDVDADGGPGARRGGAGVADRVRQRVQPAGRARHQPAARARGPRRARRVARTRRAIPARGKRAAGDRRRVAGDRRWRGRACGCCATSARLFPAHARNRARRRRSSGC